MKKAKIIESLPRLFLTAAVVVLTALLFWFNLLPKQEYEPTPNQIEGTTISDYITPDGISQTVTSTSDMRGIRVRWATHRKVPKNPVFAELERLEDHHIVDWVEIPANRIGDNVDTDIIFTRKHGPGEYLIRLTCSSESEDVIAVWESIGDSYPGGKAYNTKGEDEGRDWSFNLEKTYPSSLLIRHRAARIIHSVLILLTGIGALLWIYRKEQLKQQKLFKSTLGFAGAHAEQILIGLLVLIPTLAYLDFLAGERLYIFDMLDRGADSVGQTYPGLLNAASRVERGLWGELFNFHLGLGEAQTSFFPTLTSWVALFGETNVARLLGVSQWIKVVLSVLFAYYFAKEYGAGLTSRFAVALGYGFNCCLIARGAWETYPNISLLMILWLYTYERRLNGKNCLPFLFSTLFTFMNLVLYDCVFYAVLLPAYMLVRRIMKEQTFKAIAAALIRDLALFVPFALFGMMDIVRYQLIRALSSSRLAEGVESYQDMAGEGIFSEIGIWVSAFLRTAGLSINGVYYHTGPLNLLEGPAFYTGIMALLTAPVSLCFLQGKKKWTYLVMTLGAACYIAIVPLRLVVNGFAKETFKLSSFWITILLLLLWLEFLRALEKKQLTLGSMIAAGVSAAVIIVLLFLAKTNGYVVNTNEWIVSIILVILYTVLIVLRYKEQNVSFVRFLVICCVIAEAAMVPEEMIHDRMMESRDENSWIKHAATKEIIDSLPEDDWYRVEKDYINIFLTDPLAEGYKGSTSYLGGIEINQSVQDIYSMFELPRRGNHYFFGSGGNIRLESLAGVRYLLTRNDLEFRYGYELKETRNGIRVYENLYARPLIYYSSENPDPDELKGPYDLFSNRIGYEFKDSVYYFKRFPKNKMLVLSAAFDQEYRGVLYMQSKDKKLSSISFQSGPDTVIEIVNDEIYALWFDAGSTRTLKDISFFTVDADSYYQSFREHSLDAQLHAVPFRIEGENRFSGLAEAENDGYIITAIPYDEKWKITMDGAEQETITVNYGFLGMKIPAGEHRLEIYYAGDSWIHGNIFKLAGIFVFIFSIFVVKFKKTHKKERKNNEKPE